MRFPTNQRDQEGVTKTHTQIEACGEVNNLLLPSLTPDAGDNPVWRSPCVWVMLAEHPHMLWEASLPYLPSSLTWCPSVHDGKHINSYGSSIKHRECTETIGHRVFLHRNHREKEILVGFHTRFTSAWTSMWKTRASQASARQVELLHVEERMATCLVTPKSTMLILASTSTLGKLDTVNGNQGYLLYFPVSCRPAEWLGGRFLSATVFLFILCPRWGVPFL